MCDLCKRNDFPFLLTFCRTCNIPLVVSTQHKPNFSEEEKKMIQRLFPNRKIRFEMRNIKSHAHAHILGGK